MNRVAIATDTISIVESGWFNGVKIKPAVNHSIDNTKFYLEEDLRDIVAECKPTTNISVTMETTLEASERLSILWEDPLILNFASAKNPGGGFLRGSQAQEESLARSSSLYHSLLECPEFYKANRASGSSLYLGNAIYSPNVLVFKRDNGSYLNNYHKISVVTIPAPNVSSDRTLKGSDSVEEAFIKRTQLLMRIAKNHGHETLVLGAWGCGVFGNDQSLVAKTFKSALSKWCFKKVVFAMMGRNEIFEKTFED
jgi:uncharacterized protein (TIGR02452 family)